MFLAQVLWGVPDTDMHTLLFVALPSLLLFYLTQIIARWLEINESSKWQNMKLDHYSVPLKKLETVFLGEWDYARSQQLLFKALKH